MLAPRPHLAATSKAASPSEQALQVVGRCSLTSSRTKLGGDLPPPETALPSGDRELFRYLQAAETARGWLVGHDPGDSVERPGRDSALGYGQRI